MTLRRPAFALLMLWPLRSFAQDYSVPSLWNTSSSSIRGERVQISQTALDAVVYDSSTGLIANMALSENANLISATALHDLITSVKDNYVATSDHLSRVRPTLIPLSQKLSSFELLTWGLAAINSHRAYGDRSFLDDAQTIWEQYTPWVITTQNADNGSHPLKNITFPSQCNGASVAGGVFSEYGDGNKGSVGIIASTQGAYMTLSAYLYETTGNQTFHDSANLSYMFVQSHLYNATRGCIMDNFNLLQCQPGNDWAFTYDTGLYLEGLSVFANITNNLTLIESADTIASNSMKTSLWTNDYGVITESRSDVTKDDFGHSFKGMLIRALYEHWSRSQPDSGIANLIEKFLEVQYNAVTNVARFPSTDWYTPTWTGPPVPTMLPWGQLAAMDVLNSAIGLAPNSSTNTTSLSPTPSSSFTPTSVPSSASDRRPLRLIIGGAVGGFVALALLVLAIIYIRSRRRAISSIDAIPYNPKFRRESAVRSFRTSTDYSRSIEPFPPPFPVIDHFHSSKIRHETSPSLFTSTLSQVESQPVASSSRSLPHTLAPARENMSEEGGGNISDSVQDLMHRLNRALAHLPGPTHSVAMEPENPPPRYDN